MGLGGGTAPPAGGGPPGGGGVGAAPPAGGGGVVGSCPLALSSPPSSESASSSANEVSYRMITEYDFFTFLPFLFAVLYDFCIVLLLCPSFRSLLISLFSSLFIYSHQCDPGSTLPGALFRGIFSGFTDRFSSLHKNQPL